MVLTGLQLLTSWLLILMLAELSARDAQAEADLGEMMGVEVKAKVVESMAG